VSLSPFKLNSFVVLLTEETCVSVFACLSPLTEYQCFLWSLIVQSLTASLATPFEMPQSGSGPLNGGSDPPRE
jgi:hypothetical protein